MSRTDLLCLNRVIKAQIPLEEFLKFTADLGIRYIEVRHRQGSFGRVIGRRSTEVLQGDRR
jgi:predicted xylose isomerase-like sugar epimerase